MPIAPWCTCHIENKQIFACEGEVKLPRLFEIRTDRLTDRPTYRPSDGTDVGVEVGKEDFECQGVVGHNSCTTYRLKPSNPPQYQTPIELPKGRHRADRAQPVDPTKCQQLASTERATET